MGITGDIALIVVAALLCGLVARQFKAPALLGYIVAGFLVSPHTEGPHVVNVEQVEFLADIGVALLLFCAGLEFPVEKLAPVKKIALLGTPLQIISCILLGWGLAWSWGESWSQALWFGCMISVSSTMVVLKILSDRGLTGTLSSQVMTAILIMQDLAVIPMLILLPVLNNLDQGLATLLGALGKSILLMAAALLVGVKAVHGFVAKIASWGSRELFMVTILALGMGLGLLTYHIGLSFAFGSFLAGMLLSRSEFSHQALSDIVPLRDLFTLIFFVSVGMLIQPQFVVANWHKILGVMAAICIGKSLIFALIARLFGYVNIMPLAVGLYMFQVGEFAFVLARTGMATKSISHDLYLLIISVAALSIAITPFLANWADPIYQWWRKRTGTKASHTIPLVSTGLENHLVVIGYGHIGRFICKVLPPGTPILVIESQPQRLAQAKAEGYEVIGGDATSPDLLKAAGLPKAALLVMTIPNPLDSATIQETIHFINPHLRVMARASNLKHMRELIKYGCSEAVVPEYEAALAMLRDIVQVMDISNFAVDQLVNKVRAQQYSPLWVGNSNLNLGAPTKSSATT